MLKSSGILGEKLLPPNPHVKGHKREETAIQRGCFHHGVSSSRELMLIKYLHAPSKLNSDPLWPASALNSSRPKKKARKKNQIVKSIPFLLVTKWRQMMFAEWRDEEVSLQPDEGATQFTSAVFTAVSVACLMPCLD